LAPIASSIETWRSLPRPAVALVDQVDVRARPAGLRSFSGRFGPVGKTTTAERLRRAGLAPRATLGPFSTDEIERFGIVMSGVVGGYLSAWPRRDAGDAMKRVGRWTLRGIPLCPGVAEGRARVVLDLADPRGLEPDDILIAPLTDPAWTPLFLGAACVVVDVGAQQRHAAIVSRELGIPAVVSVTAAQRNIVDGSWVRVDGDTGDVHVSD
jgi:phosphohistidine swiveling domain-containing protein